MQRFYSNKEATASTPERQLRDMLMSAGFSKDCIWVGVGDSSADRVTLPSTRKENQDLISLKVQGRGFEIYAARVPVYFIVNSLTESNLYQISRGSRVWVPGEAALGIEVEPERISILRLPNFPGEDHWKPSNFEPKVENGSNLQASLGVVIEPLNPKTEIKFSAVHFCNQPISPEKLTWLNQNFPPAFKVNIDNTQLYVTESFRFESHSDFFMIGLFPDHNGNLSARLLLKSNNFETWQMVPWYTLDQAGLVRVPQTEVYQDWILPVKTQVALFKLLVEKPTRELVGNSWEVSTLFSASDFKDSEAFRHAYWPLPSAFRETGSGPAPDLKRLLYKLEIPAEFDPSFEDAWLLVYGSQGTSDEIYMITATEKGRVSVSTIDQPGAGTNEYGLPLCRPDWALELTQPKFLSSDSSFFSFLQMIDVSNLLDPKEVAVPNRVELAWAYQAAWPILIESFTLP